MKKKILTLAAVVTLPFILLVMYLLASMASCRDSQEEYSQEFKDSLACLFCAFADEGKLSKKDQKELLDFIDKL